MGLLDKAQQSDGPAWNARSSVGSAIPRLAVVVPMYNEIRGAETCVRTLLGVLQRLDIPTNLIVVDDGSHDGTGDLIDRLQTTLGTFLAVHQPNGGYGRALVRGAQEAHAHGFDYVVFMDSDLTNPPEHIFRFVPAILDGADLVKGTRFTLGGDMDAVRWRRRVFSILGNLVARACFRMGIADCTNGFRAIRTDLFLAMPLTERGFAEILEELYWAKRWGARVVSVPTSLTERTGEQRATSFQYGPRVLWSYLKYALRAAVLSYHPNARSSVEN